MVDQQELLENLRGNEIAIVGMSGRFPGASDIQTFWQNLVDEVCSIVFFTDEELLEAGISPFSSIISEVLLDMVIARLVLFLA